MGPNFWSEVSCRMFSKGLQKWWMKLFLVGATSRNSDSPNWHLSSFTGFGSQAFTEGSLGGDAECESATAVFPSIFFGIVKELGKRKALKVNYILWKLRLQLAAALMISGQKRGHLQKYCCHSYPSSHIIPKNNLWIFEN